MTPHLVILGNVPESEFMEGGRVRLSYMNKAFERLGFPFVVTCETA